MRRPNCCVKAADSGRSSASPDEDRLLASSWTSQQSASALAWHMGRKGFRV